MPVARVGHAALENALDVPHTAFLHRGLFRGGSTRNEVMTAVRHSRRGVEAEYVGEPRPPGLAGSPTPSASSVASSSCPRSTCSVRRSGVS